MRFTIALAVAAVIAVGSTNPISARNGPPQIPPHGMPDRSHMRPQKQPRHEVNNVNETRAQPDTVQSSAPTARSEPKETPEPEEKRKLAKTPQPQPEGESEKMEEGDDEYARPDVRKRPRKGDREGRSLGLPDQLPLGSASKPAAKNIIVQKSTERGDNMN